MKKLFGNTTGLKATQLRNIESLYRHRIPAETVVSLPVLDLLCPMSREINRQIGLLVDRSGKIVFVVIGEHNSILLPDTSDYRTPPGRLKGLRYIHTHLRDEALTQDDLTDLSLLRLDLVAAVTLSDAGVPRQMHLATIAPNASGRTPCQVYPPMDASDPGIHCLEMITAIETELTRISALHDVDPGVERAMLISVTTSSMIKAEASIAELKELARSNDIFVIDTVIQHRKKIDPRFLIGSGKIEELSILAMNKGATLIVFDQELNPSQIKSITDKLDIKVIDRSQLILDIFAQRARTSEGKLQVELAQLKYMLPRLVQRTTALSRLAGGIGGRGPGETKLEIDRRRIRERITRIEKGLQQVKKQRQVEKARRGKKGLPVISIIGYTNAGKSTLLNTLTKSSVAAENRLFATLDPSSRRLKFPQDIEVIITDTVGFIRDLPKELRIAFQATLEELESADLLLHVIDCANPDYASQIKSVNNILEDLDILHIPTIPVLNKKDLVDEETMAAIVKETEGIPISAKNASTLFPLIDKMQSMVLSPPLRPMNRHDATAGS
ncbi:MAG: GTPase HflX [Desulfobacterales bacterium CG23_combo_of_CG06-09_8_20_14_all_51_8]|nr:MAG: GTPase HflX [Desulfobacterales bacterium CG23_combo_of_CG06-09_8_20_14_all_51_8]